MRIAAYQFAVTGDMVENFEKIKNAILLAKKNAVQLLVFPECALTGYPPRDIKSSSEVRFDLVEIAVKSSRNCRMKPGLRFLWGRFTGQIRFTTGRFYFSQISLFGSMISGLCGGGIESILPREAAMAFLK